MAAQGSLEPLVQVRILGGQSGRRAGGAARRQLCREVSLALQVHSPRRSRALSAAVRTASAAVVTALWVVLVPPRRAPLSAQVGPVSAPGADTVVSEQAARDALSQARSAQSRFERQRRQFSPAERGGWVGTSCDEN